MLTSELRERERLDTEIECFEDSRRSAEVSGLAGVEFGADELERDEADIEREGGPFRCDWDNFRVVTFRNSG